jgi:6-phosphogluconate dehydrogenase
VAHFISQLESPRVVWLMLPAAVVDSAIADLSPHLAAGDIVVDGGNSHYVDAIRRANALDASGVQFVDVGVSGGVWGLERGYCLMIGGAPAAVSRLEPCFARSRRAKTRRDRRANHGRRRVSALRSGRRRPLREDGAQRHRMALMGAYAEGFNILAHANAGGRDRSADAETAPLAHPEHYQHDLPLPRSRNCGGERQRDRIVAARPHRAGARGASGPRAVFRPRV